MGYAGYLGRYSTVNSSLVDLLLAAGAILYVRTNVPQTLMVRSHAYAPPSRVGMY